MKPANPFEIEGEARRFQVYRPRYHHIPFKLVSNYLAKNLSSALDVACGTGHSTIALSKITKSIVGCDLSTEMLKEARSTSSTIEFVQASAENLPFDGNNFDFVNISMGFHWLDQKLFLQEVTRVLETNGHLCIDNYGFSGKISNDPNKQKIHCNFFDQILPPASKKSGYPNDELLKLVKLAKVEEFPYKHTLDLTAEEFVNLIMTWSNFQIQTKDQKVKTSKKMFQTYNNIFEDQKLPLEFSGKAILYMKHESI